MDMQAFETDLRNEAKKLPKELVVILRTLAEKFGPTLDQIFPTLMENLSRHIAAIMGEIGMGILDKDALNQVIVRVLKEFE